MPTHYKAFLVVMLATLVAFALARPVFIRFMAVEDFARRRNLWLALTACAFLLPDFWAYMGVAAVLVFLAARKDPNPAALYMFLLMVVPPFTQPVPGFGLVNYLFTLDHFRLLSLALVVPCVIRMRRQARLTPDDAPRSRWFAPDAFLVVYAALPVLVSAPYIPFTGVIRGAFLAVIGICLPYYLLSRSCTSKAMVVEAISAFTLSAVVLSPLAIFEAGKGWLMYSDIASHWGIDTDSFGYLMRGDVLRAQVTSGQSIVLGNFFAVALGLWLYLQAQVTGARRWLGTAAIAAGLLAALSRGPWVGAVIALFAYYAIGPDAKTRLPKFIGLAILVSAAVLISPVGSQVIDHLPFIGTIDEGNVAYREAVNERSMLLIRQNPWFGSPYFIYNMEDLRTGQGIIDLLNVYLTIALNSGLVTLVAFLLFLGSIAWWSVSVVRKDSVADPDSGQVGAAIMAAFLGTLVTINTVSDILSVPYVYLSLAALLVAYAKLPRASMDAVVHPAESLRGASPLGSRR